MEADEVHSEDNRTLPEKGKKRRLKTPSQVVALEMFYKEHKYPSEEMKSQLAGSLGLTEKQVSGWFCHRRLKDKKSEHGEAAANGRQDRSSGIVQDHGSGHRQDSCGSTKQEEDRHFDPKEVESKRFRGQEFSAADLAYEHGHHRNENDSDTSSGSRLPSQHRFHHRKEDPFDMATSRYLPQNENIAPINSMGIRARIGPSGYLKVKGKVESTAITAVKRQLGRHYREDGPLLGVEFDPLPPGAFGSSVRDPVKEPYYLGEPNLPHSPDSHRIRHQPNSGMRYDAYNSKMSSHDSDFDGTSFKILCGSDHRENRFGTQPKKKPLLPNHSNHFPGRNSTVEMDETYSTVELSVYDSIKPSKMRATHGVEGRIMDSVSNQHPRPYYRKVSGGQTEPWLHNSGDVSPRDADREHFDSKYSNITLKRSEFMDTEDRGLSRRTTKEDKSYGERKSIIEYCNSARAMIYPTNETTAAKRELDEFPMQQCAKKVSMAEETPQWRNQIKRSAVEMPSSFSEDETAETSSSVD